MHSSTIDGGYLARTALWPVDDLTPILLRYQKARSKKEKGVEKYYLLEV